MSVYDFIANEEGVLFTKWGPCFCDPGKEGECVACRHAQAIEDAGLDYNEEYDKAKRKARGQ